MTKHSMHQVTVRRLISNAPQSAHPKSQIRNPQICADPPPLLRPVRRRRRGDGAQRAARAGWQVGNCAAPPTVKIDPANPLAPRGGHLPAKAKNVIYLFMAGAPSQLELFDDKPKLRELHGKTPPPSLLEGKRFAFLKGNETLMGSVAQVRAGRRVRPDAQRDVPAPPQDRR